MMTRTRLNAGAFALLFLLSAATAISHEDDRIRVCSYSLEGFAAGDRVRGEAIGRLIAEIDPEILCVQDLVDERAYRYLADSILAPLGLIGSAEFDDMQRGYVAIFHDPHHFLPGAFAVQIEEDVNDQLAILFRHRGSGDTILVTTLDVSAMNAHGTASTPSASGRSLSQFLQARRFILTETDLIISAGDLGVRSTNDIEVRSEPVDHERGDPSSGLMVDPIRRPARTQGSEGDVDPTPRDDGTHSDATIGDGDAHVRSDHILLSPRLHDRYLIGSYRTFGASGHPPLILDIAMPIRQPSSDDVEAMRIGLDDLN